MFNRIAIVNRGEAAMRLINAVRDLAAETGERIDTIALFTDVDKTATFVREADVAYELGAAAARPYLNMKLLEEALIATKADAAWVGWGFVAEDPAFAELCERIGVAFIGPSAQAMRTLGDKIGAKLIAEEAGVPVAPWSRGPVDSADDALAAAERIGYPLMLKATAGGGGRGIRVVRDADELIDAYQRTRAEAERAFGSGVVFLERLVTGARHVEVQVIADAYGTAWALGVRDCSVQRRNQKVIEESASPVLSADNVARLKDSAERLAVKVGYCGAATVEFLYHLGEDLLAFLEVNTRLQVEHPITETVTSCDLVRAQLHVAAGGALAGTAPVERGHAIEARLNAEDPDRDFAPAPGRIDLLQLPTGPGIRVDTGVSTGDTIPADFDSMIAKIIAYGHDREQALGRLRRAIAQTKVLIHGGATNKSFLLDLLGQSEVIDGSADTGWIDRVRAEGRLSSQAHSGVALAVAGVEAYDKTERMEMARLLTTASGGRPQVRHESGRPIDVKLRGASYRLRVTRQGAHHYGVIMEAGGQTRTAEVIIDRFDAHTAQVSVNGETHRIVVGNHGPVHVVDVDGITHRISRDEGGVVRSPAPALVVATPVAVGDEVDAGAAIMVLESMKMETVVRAPFAARVVECAVSGGTQVAAGAPLLRLEHLGGADVDVAASEAELDVPTTQVEADLAEQVRESQRELRGILLGYDADPDHTARAVERYLQVRRAATGAGQRQLVAELELVEVFTDLAALSHNRTFSASDESVEHVHSAREYFHTYLRSLDVDRAGLPASFTDKLARALARYGVDELARCAELEAAVFRMFLVQQYPVASVAVITALLRAWLTEPQPGDCLREPIGHALERLVTATQVRFSAIADLVRGVVYAWYGQPLLLRNRAKTYVTVRRNLRYLADNPHADDRDERIAEMVRSTEPLVRLLGQRLVRGETRNVDMLEVLTRRYYGNKDILAVEVIDDGATTFVVARREGFSVMTAAVRMDDFDAALSAVARTATNQGSVSTDIYLSWENQPDDLDELSARLGEAVRAYPMPDQVRRITVTVAGSHGKVMHHHVTFRPSAAGMSEERLIRGLHPYVARRMQMDRWRLFDLTRVPSSDDEEVYLYRCSAQQNPADERLVAFTQVRDLTPLRDTEGRLIALPTAENTIAACLDSIRRTRVGQPGRNRSDTNRIVMYLWPVIDFPTDDAETIIRRVVTASAGAGLDEIEILGRVRDQQSGELKKVAITIAYDLSGRAEVSFGAPDATPVAPLDAYRQKVLRARSRNTVYPYELTDVLGEFTEYDLDDDGVLVAVDRPKGNNSAAIVVGVASIPTEKYPEGMSRVVLLGDPTKALGALSQPECRRVAAALDLAEDLGVPVEWYALSAGARVSMESGTENMDWVAVALKRIVEFTQAGGEINVVVAGINVGAQPYWNAEATMLMHTKGILVMTPESAMVLTGKQSLDFSGGVSAEDNYGIGGYDRVMGPNGQAQYWAPDLVAARDVVLAHYDHTYVAPGEAGPRRRRSADPVDRDVREFPHELADSDFATVGDIFSIEKNPDRKKAFDIRTVLRAVADADAPLLERWAGMADADTAVVADAHLGGYPVCMIGIESRGVPRTGFPPTDGPDTFTAGTLFPQSSKKVARAINTASGNRPVVVLANLSGFDGSPESMRKLQLEYGAEIGRAIVNFDGPIVFCVISRYHGGAFVVFSKALNPNMTVLALEGSYASVLGGAPAAAVVFARDVKTRTEADSRVRDLVAKIAEATGTQRAALQAELAEARASVHAEKVSEVAAEFDAIHSIQRAVEVGSVDEVIAAGDMRPRIIAALQSAE